jgi:glycerol-3-phosphate O-acyltransferase
MQTRGEADIDALGAELMRRVGAVVPVLPVSLVATVMREADGPLSPLDVKSRTQTLMRALVASGAHAHIPRGDDDYAVEVGLRMMRLRRLVLEADGLLTANPDEAPLLDYYANAIAHLPREQGA